MLNRCVDVDESVAATKFVWRFKVDQRTDWHVSPKSPEVVTSRRARSRLNVRATHSSRCLTFSPTTCGSTPSTLFRMRSIWQSMPRSSFALIIAAVFMTFTPIGFLADVYSVGANSPGRLALVAAFSGSIAVAYLYSFRLNHRFLPIVIAIHFAFTLLPTGAPFMQLHAAATGSALRGRLTFRARTRRSGRAVKH